MEGRTYFGRHDDVGQDLLAVVRVVESERSRIYGFVVRGKVEYGVVLEFLC
jgi:hypothetical protein